jgi:hypothetical protein
VIVTLRKNSTVGPSGITFKIVLPFLYTSQVVGNGFGNVSVTAPSVGVNYIVYGNKYAAGIALNQQFIVNPAISYDYSGRSVSNAGDINGDGYDDLIIGVPYSDVCYVLFGNERGYQDTSDGFTISTAVTGTLTGWSVSSAGDVNNDGFDDIIMGAPYASNGLIGSAGVTYVILGRKTQFSDINLDTLTETQGFLIYGAAAGDCSGMSVSGAGEIKIILLIVLSKTDVFCRRHEWRWLWRCYNWSAANEQLVRRGGVCDLRSTLELFTRPRSLHFKDV